MHVLKIFDSQMDDFQFSQSDDRLMDAPLGEMLEPYYISIKLLCSDCRLPKKWFYFYFLIKSYPVLLIRHNLDSRIAENSVFEAALIRLKN